MGGKRAAFHVKARAGSPFWQFHCTIDGQPIREALNVTIAEDPNKRKAGREAAARYLHHCARLGSKPAPVAVEQDTMTLLEQYVDTDLAARARKRGPRYAEIEETRLVKYVVPRFPLISMITRQTWEEAQGTMRGVKLSTIQRVTVSLRLFLRYCVRIGAILALPMLTAPSGTEAAADASQRRAFTEGERDRFLREVRKLNARAGRVYTALLYTALRKGALEKMLPGWIDWRANRVTFPPGTLKSRKARSFWLHPLARKAIKAEMGFRRNNLPVFGRFDYDSHNERSGLFWTACRRARIPFDGLTAHHVTRHTACTIAGNNGATLAELMALGGWDTPAMAMRYLHLDAQQGRKAVERL